MERITTRLILLVLLPVVLGACGGSEDPNEHALVRGDFPVAFVARRAEVLTAPTDTAGFAPGGDLIVLEAASASAPRRNVTERYTQGRGDVQDPEVSYDGRRIVFSMRGPHDPSWNIWEYELGTDTLRRVIADDSVANAGDDLDPYYLPDGRIVFSSNRQTGFRARLAASGMEARSHLDRAGRERAAVLHVMDGDGTSIQQISYNPSHDRDPVVLSSGELLYSRWDQAGDRSQMPLYRARPDGTGMDVYYGAYSPGDSFLHPREMQDGRLIATVVPLNQRALGGALAVIDARRYSDAGRPAVAGAPADGGQHQPTYHTLPLGDEISPVGRYTTPYPLWDDTGRVLVAWTSYQAIDGRNPLTDGAGAPEGRPHYGIYVLDPASGRQRPIALPEDGMIHLDPVAVMPRPTPPALPAVATSAAAPTPADPRPADPGGDGSDGASSGSGSDSGVACPADATNQTRPAEPAPAPEDPSSKPSEDGGDGCSGGGSSGGGAEPPPDAPSPMAVLNVKSVYDTDFAGLMGEAVLLEDEALPETAEGVPDLRALRDAARTTAADRPARFLRVSRALPMPPGLALDSVGATAFKMQQIVGYAPIEPDGSVRVRVPADAPLALAVVDAEGRALQTHTHWLQVRPGEERVCSGCHAPKRQPALNSGSDAGGPFEHSDPALSALAGETMAETLTRLVPEALNLDADMVYQDVWTDPTTAGRPRDPDLVVDYAGLEGAAPRGGLINYPDHIQPLWEQSNSRTACVECHGGGAAAGGLDLSARTGALGRLASYDALVLGALRLDPATGAPRVVRRDGRYVFDRHPPLVTVGGALDSARATRLLEELYERDLNAPEPHPGIGSVDHRGMLNASELRLLAEWIDLGAQYYNNPWSADAGSDGSWDLDELRDRVALDRDGFEQQVHPVLIQRCAGCHRVHGRSGDPDDLRLRNGGLAPNRFMLTGAPEGDFHVTSGFVRDACAAAASPLLLRATGTELGAPPHPRLDGAGTPQDAADDVPTLQVGEDDYMRIFDWIAAACG